MEPVTIGLGLGLAWTVWKALTGPKGPPAPEPPKNGAATEQQQRQPPVLDQASRDFAKRVLFGGAQTLAPQEIQAFQARWGLPQTGALDAATLSVVRAIAPHLEPPPNRTDASGEPQPPHAPPAPPAPQAPAQRKRSPLAEAFGKAADVFMGTDAAPPPSSPGTPPATGVRPPPGSGVVVERLWFDGLQAAGGALSTPAAPAVVAQGTLVANDLATAGPSKYSREQVAVFQGFVGLPRTGLFDTQTKGALDAVVPDAPPVFAAEPGRATFTIVNAVMETEDEVLKRQYDALLEEWRENVRAASSADWSEDALGHFMTVRARIEAQLRALAERLIALGWIPKPLALEDGPWQYRASPPAGSPPRPEAPATGEEVDIRNLPAGDPRRMSAPRG